MKSIYRLTRYINTYTSQIRQWIFLTHMQPKQNILIPGEDDNILENFGSYENEKSTLKEQDIEKNHEKLAGKSSNTRSCVKNGLSGHTPQDKLFTSELSSFSY